MGRFHLIVGNMARSNRPWPSGPEPTDSEQTQGYPGETLGLPEHGSGSLARMGRRLAALLVDWLLAYGIAALAITLGLLPVRALSSAVLVIWLVIGLLAVRLFEFTPGQFATGSAGDIRRRETAYRVGSCHGSRVVDRVRHTGVVRRPRRAWNPGSGDRHCRRAALTGRAVIGGARFAARRASWRCRAAGPWALPRSRPGSPAR